MESFGHINFDCTYIMKYGVFSVRMSKSKKQVEDIDIFSILYDFSMINTTRKMPLSTLKRYAYTFSNQN